MIRFFKLSILSLLLIPSLVFSQDRKLDAYKIYNQKGKEVNWRKLIKTVEKQDIVFLGEYHNNPISHWIQFELVQAIADSSKQIKIGAEMFEADNQTLIDEYFKGIVNTKNFEKECRLWNNYQTDYKPILEFSKEQKIPFIATNIPRRYASAIYYHGDSILFDLSAEAKKWVCPLPFPFPKSLECYKGLMEMTGHGGENLAKAQAVKDATMAYFILNNYQSGDLFIHLNGNQHSVNHEGIIWYINNQKSDLNILSIHTEENGDLEWQKDYEGLADFILVVKDSMTKTY